MWIKIPIRQIRWIRRICWIRRIRQIRRIRRVRRIRQIRWVHRIRRVRQVRRTRQIRGRIRRIRILKIANRNSCYEIIRKIVSSPGKSLDKFMAEF